MSIEPVQTTVGGGGAGGGTATVSSAEDLNADIAYINANGVSGDSFTLQLSGDITLDQALDRLDLQPGVSLVIDGAGHTLDGGAVNGSGGYGGLFVDAGTVEVENLTIADAVAQGHEGGVGVGGGGGGGGAGLGGGLFVESAGQVTLGDVNFDDDAARGGNGGGAIQEPSGSGGIGGADISGNFAYGGGHNGFNTGYGGSNGGFGGGGGGGGGGYFTTHGGGGGKGGFGGGGGGGGHGTEGGGGGGGAGFGGGAGVRGNNTPYDSGVGGGGLGAGGDIFIQAGASLTVTGGRLTGGSVAGGGGGGQALGASLFLQVAAGTTDTVGSVIADGSGQPGQVLVMGSTDGSGGLGSTGGTVVLTGANTYTGGTTVEGGAAISVSADDNLGASSSTLELDNGTALDFTRSFTFTHAITVSGDPTFDVAPGKTVVDTNVIADGSSPGDVVLTGGGTLELDATNTFSGGISIEDGTLKLDSAAAAGSGPISFQPAGQNALLSVNLTDFQPDLGNLTNFIYPDAIGNFDSTSDVIEIKGLPDLLGASATDDGSHLVITDGPATYTFDLANSTGQTEYVYADGKGDTFVTSDPNYQPDAVCFTADVRILTDRGEVRVAALEVGHRVVTVSGALQPIVWIGRQTVSTEDRRPEAVLPIRIKAGALGDNVPVRDLVVSPAHAIHLAGRLVPARCLLNGVSIVREEVVGPVDYWHIELPAHDVVIADGAPAESYLDTGNRGSLRTLDHADVYLRDAAITAEPCFPLLEQGPELVRIRERLFERLGAQGMRPAADPGLRLLVDGHTISPTRRQGDLHGFAVPPGASEIRIVSRANAPIEVRPQATDTRRLGVALAGVTLRAPGLTLRIAHDHPGLIEGFHASEKGHRWTTGDARLPDAVVSLLDAAGGEIELHVTGRATYWPDEERELPSVSEGPLATLAG